MTRFVYNAHRVLAGAFVLAIIFSGTNYYLELGFFGRSAKGVVIAVLALFLIYVTFFSPTREDMKMHARTRTRSDAADQ
jgi:hypothetical protein